MAKYDSSGWTDRYPGGDAPHGTGAPGSQGDQASESFGPEVGRPVVSNPFGSSQLAENRPVLSVQSGDTSGMSSDQAVQASLLSPGPVSGPDSYGETGAGAGHTIAPQPNAGR